MKHYLPGRHSAKAEMSPLIWPVTSSFRRLLMTDEALIHVEQRLLLLGCQ